MKPIRWMPGERMTRHRTIEGTAAGLPPFDFAKTLDFLRGFPPTLGKLSVVGDSLYLAARVTGRTVLFHVRCKFGAGDGVLDYTLHTTEPEETEGLEQDAVWLLRWLLSLDDDLGEFYGVAKNDTCFVPVIRELHGYHQVKFGSPFEAATWAIVSQRNRLSTARTLYQSFLEAVGHRIHLDGHDYWAFPDPQEVAPLEEAALPLALHDFRRAEYILDVARALASVKPDFLQCAPDGEVEGWLLGIRGIGPWSARFILLRSMGRYQGLPENERELTRSASLVYGTGLTLTPQDVETISNKYGRWRGYWAHYLRVWAQNRLTPRSL